MNKAIFKIFSAILVLIFLNLSIVPIMANASELDTAKKVILKNIEDIEKIDENKYPGYKERLTNLKKEHPNWTFTIYYTGIDWNTAITNESEGLHSRSLVQNKSGEWICSTCGNKVYDSGGWMCASKKAVANLMDPRNYLTTNYIFQFEKLSYDEDMYTVEGIEKVLNGTFMYQTSINTYYNNDNFEDIKFSEAIIEAANSSGVSPYYLAARIRQEIGINGSDSVYGTYEGYEGIYNFYNIGANSGEKPIENGLKYASNTTLGKYLLPWNDPAKAIKGGAIWIAANYISIGQDTLYFQKFDVVSNGTTYYTHQYMQNIFAAKSEGYTTYNAYNKLGLLNNNYNFVIPMYENMPKALSEEPSNTIDLNEKVQINASNVNVRKEPTTKSNIIATLAKGTIITRMEKNVTLADGYRWDKVRLSNGQVGYVVTNYLTTNIITTTAVTNTVQEEKVQINASNVNIRSRATTTSNIIATLSKGTILTRLQKDVAKANGYIWDKVRLPNGQVGYVASKYLSTNITTTNINNTNTKTVTKVTTYRVKLRSKASTKSTTLATVKRSTRVTILQANVAKANGYTWDKVKLSNGKIGYIANKYLK